MSTTLVVEEEPEAVVETPPLAQPPRRSTPLEGAAGGANEAKESASGGERGGRIMALLSLGAVSDEDGGDASVVGEVRKEGATEAFVAPAATKQETAGVSHEKALDQEENRVDTTGLFTAHMSVACGLTEKDIPVGSVARRRFATSFKALLGKLLALPAERMTVERMEAAPGVVTVGFRVTGCSFSEVDQLHALLSAKFRQDAGSQGRHMGKVQGETLLVCGREREG